LGNPNPTIFKAKKDPARDPTTSLWGFSADENYNGSERVDDIGELEPIDADEVYDLIRSLFDPEHPTTTLEQLGVVSADEVTVNGNHVKIQFTPTVPHCPSATLIGLTIRVRLLRALPVRMKVDISVKEGTHQSEQAVNKQLNDKERVAAALENTTLLDLVNNCLSSASLRGRDPIQFA